MKLIVATPSPFARKVRVALIEKEIAFETAVDVPWNPGSMVADQNPLGKVPVLMLDDGRVFYDSKVIVEYLETLDLAPRLIPHDPGLRVAHRQIEALADGVCDALVLVVLERNRKPELQSMDWIERQMRKIRAGTAEVSRLLGAKEWFFGDQFGLADIAVGCMMGYLDLRLPEFGWRAIHPDLAAFAQKLARRRSFELTVPAAQSIAEMR